MAQKEITLRHGFLFWSYPVVYVSHGNSNTVWFRKDNGKRATLMVEYQLAKMFSGKDW